MGGCKRKWGGRRRQIAHEMHNREREMLISDHQRAKKERKEKEIRVGEN